MRIWNSYPEVEKAVETIDSIYSKHGSLPPPLVEAYNKNLEKARRGIVARFYEELSERCPEAMKYFMGGEEK